MPEKNFLKAQITSSFLQINEKGLIIIGVSHILFLISMILHYFKYIDSNLRSSILLFLSGVMEVQLSFVIMGTILQFKNFNFLTLFNGLSFILSILFFIYYIYFFLVIYLEIVYF